MAEIHNSATGVADAESGVDLLTIEQVAARLQLRRETIFRWTCSGRFPVAVLRLGRARRIRRMELEDWVTSGCPSRNAWQWPASEKRT